MSVDAIDFVYKNLYVTGCILEINFRLKTLKIKRIMK